MISISINENQSLPNKNQLKRVGITFTGSQIHKHDEFGTPFFTCEQQPQQQKDLGVARLVKRLKYMNILPEKL